LSVQLDLSYRCNTHSCAGQLTGKVPVPREAASLMEALKDAESGRAQRKNGDGLDVMVPEGVSELVLEDGVSP
jgi:hypothetical protein